MESLSFVALYQTSLRGIRWHVCEPGASHATQPLALLLLSLVLSMVPIRDKYQTWYWSQSRRRWATPPSRLFPICALNLQRFVNNPSNKQIDFQAGKQQRKIIIPTRSQAAAAEAPLISHPPHCWWAKSCVASSLAWLAWKADGLWGGRGVPPRHAWLRNGVWSLLALFAKALAGPFWRPRSLSPPLMVGNRAKYF